MAAVKTVAMTTIRGWGPLPDLVRTMASNRTLVRTLKHHDIPLCVLDAPQGRIPLVKMLRIFEAAARETGDPSLGRKIGDSMSVVDYGDWGAYAAGANDLLDGLHRVCRTIWAHESGSRMFLSEREDHVVWTYTTGFETAETARQFSDHLLKPMLDFVRAFLGGTWMPDWLEVGYAAPQRQKDGEALLDVPIHYEQPGFGLPLQRADLCKAMQVAQSLPRPLTSIDLLKHRPRRSGDGLRPVLETVDLCLMDGMVDLDAVARCLDLGPRTLQRHLTRHGVTFREVLQEARQRRATALLLETHRTVKTIAADLGYGEPANFTRAFRNWYGVSPTEFRLAAKSAHDPLRREVSNVAK